MSQPNVQPAAFAPATDGAHDVVVVGGGAAGISAARRLTALGRSVLIVEAAPRLGGRAHTVALQDMPFDLGCGWLHSAERNPLTTLAEAQGRPLDRSDGAWRRQLHDIDFPVRDQNEAWAAYERLSHRLRHTPPASDALAPGDPWRPLGWDNKVLLSIDVRGRRRAGGVPPAGPARARRDRQLLPAPVWPPGGRGLSRRAPGAGSGSGRRRRRPRLRHQRVARAAGRQLRPLAHRHDRYSLGPRADDPGRIGLVAIRCQRERLEHLRNEQRVGPDAFLVLQEELDFAEVALTGETGGQIEES